MAQPIEQLRIPKKYCTSDGSPPPKMYGKLLPKQREFPILVTPAIKVGDGGMSNNKRLCINCVWLVCVSTSGHGGTYYP